MALPSVENIFKNKLSEKNICDFYLTRLVDHFDTGTKQVIICDKISILDFAYVSYLKDRTSRMAEDITKQQIKDINSAVAYSIACDESTDKSDIEQIALFYRYENSAEPQEDIIELIPLKGQTLREDICEAILECLRAKSINTTHLVSVATDGARSMTGDEYSGLCQQERYRDAASMRGRSRSPRPVKARKSKSEVILIVFLGIKGIVHFEFLPQGQIVNQTVSKDILRHLVRSVRDKRRSLWEAPAWTLDHDNASAHTALSIHQFLVERNIATLKHIPYSPDLSPCDFSSFLRLNLF